MLAYLGQDILLSSLLLDPEHSLEKQAWDPKELLETRINADGFGFAWYNQLQGKPEAARYRQILPIWGDPNLNNLSNSMSKPLWLAMVRSATPGLGTTLENTQPFCHQQWTFVHNGYIEDFNGEIRHKIRDKLSDTFLYLIGGNTDSEYIFALLMQCLDQATPAEAIRLCVSIIKDIIQDKRSLLNIIFSDGQQIFSLRHAINGLSPSLYYTNNTNEFGNRNQLLASEKLNSETQWQVIDEHKIVILQNNKNIEIIDL